MVLSRFFVGLFIAAIAVFGTGLASSQSYPNRAVRLVAGDPGGGSDFQARVIAQKLSTPLGQPVIVENRSGIPGAEMVAKSPPDGYTLLVAGSTLWVVPFLREVPYDAAKDFAPVILIGSQPTMVVVHPSLPIKSVKDLVALAKARPGELNYAAATPGSPTHLAGELFKTMAGVNIVGVPYKGTAPALYDLIGGRVQLMFANAAAVTPYVKAGRLRALAVSSAQPSPLFPDLPTVAATGVPGFETVTLHSIFAPAKTPAAVTARLHQDILGVLNQPEVKTQLFNAGLEILGSSPEQLAALMKADMARMAKLIKEAGIKG
jgi:tripartite-type tricarboxylate transporter receptor subunit TctC